jgi:selenocysteine-specific elongation factor
MGKVRVVAFPGDRFVLRDETGVRTIGGGRVLLVDAPRHRRRDAYTAERLANLETADAVARVAAYLELCDGLGATTANLVRGVGMSQSAVTRIVADETRFVRMGADEGTAVFVAGDRYQLYTGKLLARVQAHHETTTSAPGLEIERLRQTLEPLVDSRLFRAVLDRLCGEGRLERRGGSVAVPGHTVRMSPM